METCRLRGFDEAPRSGCCCCSSRYLSINGVLMVSLFGYLVSVSRVWIRSVVAQFSTSLGHYLLVGEKGWFLAWEKEVCICSTWLESEKARKGIS